MLNKKISIRNRKVDPYKQKLTSKNFFYSKIDIQGKVVVVLDGRLENRSLNLIVPISRAFKKYDVIELIGTDEENAKPGENVNAIAYIGFVEILNSGVILVGDEVIISGKKIGTIAGYDDTHLPNHQNVIVKMEKRIPGKELNIKIKDEVLINGF
jgi:hypothetical protein